MKKILGTAHYGYIKSYGKGTAHFWRIKTLRKLLFQKEDFFWKNGFTPFQSPKNTGILDFKTSDTFKITKLCIAKLVCRGKIKQKPSNLKHSSNILPMCSPKDNKGKGTIFFYNFLILY